MNTPWPSVDKLTQMVDSARAEEQRWYAGLPTRVIGVLALAVLLLTVLLSLLPDQRQRKEGDAAPTPAQLASAAARAASSAASHAGQAVSAAAVAASAAEAASQPGTSAPAPPSAAKPGAAPAKR